MVLPPAAFIGLRLNAQAPRELKCYLGNKQVSQAAKDYQLGRFRAIDDDRTFSIADSLDTKNNLTRPLYLYLVSKMLDRADGALSEVLGLYCKAFAEQYPDYLIDFLYSGARLVDNRFADNWAKALAGGFMFDCEVRITGCIQQSLNRAVSIAKPGNKQKLTQLYTKVEQYCHESSR